jgi:20S proteasome alpha/beta subunit
MASSMAASMCCVLLSFALPSLVFSSSAPWQTQRNNVWEESMYKNMPPTVFSSSGRLYTVESMVAAASNPEDVSSNVVAAISFDEGILVVSCRKQSPHLDVDNCTDTGSLLFPPSSNFQVGPQVYATTAGNAADSQILRDKVLQISFMLWERASGGLGTGASLPLPPSLLARHVADHLQRPTQQVSSGKILAVSVPVWVRSYLC